MADVREIEEFLGKAKELIRAGLFDLVPRKKNIDSIKAAGLTIKHVKDIIYSLDYTNYCRGPMTDIDCNRRGFIWELGCNIEGVEFYIKVKIEKRQDKECLICLSFHVAEYPLHYPKK